MNVGIIRCSYRCVSNKLAFLTRKTYFKRILPPLCQSMGTRCLFVFTQDLMHVEAKANGISNAHGDGNVLKVRALPRTANFGRIGASRSVSNGRNGSNGSYTSDMVQDSNEKRADVCYVGILLWNLNQSPFIRHLRLIGVLSENFR